MDRDEIRQIVEEVLREKLLGGSSTPTNEQWVDLNLAWEKLGYPSYKACYKDVESGLFRVGKEVRDRRKPNAKRAKWQINLALAHQRLSQKASDRFRR